jgi:hypothetical protein
MQNNQFSPLQRANLSSLMMEAQPTSEILCVSKLTDDYVQEHALLHMAAV